MINRIKAEFARALRNHRYEKTPTGAYFAKQDFELGGVFHATAEGGPRVEGKNTVTLQWLNNLLDVYFNNGSSPTGLYLAPFINNTVPSSALTSANFAGTQGEYTAYTEVSRPQWVSNGPAANQHVSNLDAPGVITVGAAAATIRGAALISIPTKGAVTGILVAGALFEFPNTYGPGTPIKLGYDLSGSPRT